MGCSSAAGEQTTHTCNWGCDSPPDLGASTSTTLSAARNRPSSLSREAFPSPSPAETAAARAFAAWMCGKWEPAASSAAFAGSCMSKKARLQLTCQGACSNRGPSTSPTLVAPAVLAAPPPPPPPMLASHAPMSMLPSCGYLECAVRVYQKFPHTSHPVLIELSRLLLWCIPWLFELTSARSSQS